MKGTKKLARERRSRRIKALTAFFMQNSLRNALAIALVLFTLFASWVLIIGVCAITESCGM